MLIHLKSYLKKYFVFFLLMLSFFVGTVSQYIRINGHKENDHWVYYRTAQRIENKNIHDIYTRKDGALPFRYSPPTLMLFSWMSGYDEITSRQIWLVIQALFILASLGLLYLILLKIDSPSPLNSVAFSFFLFYRYFLDALFCGQIVGLSFFAFTLSLFFWVNGQKKKSNNALLFLSLLKIVPGFLIMINFLDSKNWKEFLKLALYLTLTLLAIHGIYFFWFIMKFGFNNISEFLPMFKNWISIVQADQNYFDGSTSKSQALRSVILRLLGPNEKSEFIWKMTSIVGFISLYVFWYKQKMTTLKIRVFAYSFGILLFVMLMPQSLPYQIFKLLIPLVFIMNEFIATFRKRFGVLLFFILIFCSLSTADLTGHAWADFVQYKSLPFLTFVLMGFILLKEVFLIQRSQVLYKTQVNELK